MENHEQTLEARLLLAAADWLTLLLLAAGALFPCLSAYGISDRYGFDLGGVLAFCVFGSLAAAAVFTWRRWYWAVLAVLAAEGLVFWRLWAHMEEDWLRVREPGLGDLLEQSPGALILLYVLALLLLGWTVVRARAWWLAAAAVVLPVLPAIQSGVLPAWGAMLAGFAGWGSMLLTGLFDRRDPRSLGRARLLSLGGMAALTVLLVMALPMEGYIRPQWATDARVSLIQGVNRQLERFFSPEELENDLLTQLGLDLTIPSEGTGSGTGSGSGGGPLAIESVSGGSGQRENLLNVGPQRYTLRQVMTVRTNQPNSAGRVYLRGVSFDTYTGTSWEQSERDLSGSWQYPIMTVPDRQEYTMSIRFTNVHGIWYYPYRFAGGGTMSESGRLIAVEDDLPASELQPFRGEEFDTLYCPGGPEDGFVPLESEAAAALDAYRNTSGFSRSYLTMSSSLWNSLQQNVEALQQMPGAVDSRLPEQFRPALTAAAQTAAYLASIAAYDPNTPAMEEGEDFIAHFLEEGRGYCVHFATAGTILLRMQGIPARYVSGYVADLDTRGRGAVQDSDAHAWVEIFLDGYGWYPVEMTPGYSGGASGVGLEGAAAVSEPEEPEPEVPEEEPEEEPLPEEEPPDREEENPEELSPGGENPEAGEAPGGAEPEGRSFAALWKALSIAAVFWAVLCAAYLLAQLVRKRAREDRDTNRSVLNAYGRYQRLRRWGCGEDEELIRLAKKAKFSQHTLTAEEREAAWKCLDEDLRQSRIGQPLRRRWLLAMLCPIF